MVRWNEKCSAHLVSACIIGEVVMNREMIAKTEDFLKDTFAKSTYLQNNPTDRDYRLEHSYRVANIAKAIAEAE